MQASLDSLVGTLYRRFQRSGEEDITLVPAHLFAIASDLVSSLSTHEQEAQLEQLLQALEMCGCANQSECTPELVITVSALLVGSSSSDMELKFQQAVAALLRSFPPLPESVRSCAWYSAAQVIVRGRCAGLLEKTCNALEKEQLNTTTAEESAPIPIADAVEVISASTALLVLCRPTQLLPETFEDPLTAGKPKAKEKKGASSRKKTTDVRQVYKESAANATQQNSSPAPPSNMSLPSMVNDETVAALRALFVSCSLKALQPGSAVQREGIPPAALCRRILIPLLLMDGGKGLAEYEQMVHDLLQFLAASEDEERTGEVIVLMAALFEFLFMKPNLNEQEDYRFSGFLWSSLHRAFWDALTADSDAGRRANMQLRAEYLLKRIVHLTNGQESATQNVCLPSKVHFHELFVWTRGSSYAQWELFFLVLETLNEFGLHIIQPAMVKLESLVMQLAISLEASGECNTHAALHPRWIEVLLLKLVTHPNLGVRKLGLRRVWRMPVSVLRTFSESFLFQYLFQSSSDPRLCSDLDRVPITATFLETKAFDGLEEKAMPNIEPLANDMERFYSSIFLEQLHSAESRAAALCVMLDTTMKHSARFTVSVCVRIMHHISQQLALEAVRTPAALSWTTGMMLSDTVLDKITSLMRDTMHENVPFWLDVRLTAIMFSTFLTFAALDPTRFRAKQSFWRLMCMCGPLGQSGGRSLAQVDACGQYGCGGASLDVRFLNARLVAYSSQLRLAKQPSSSANLMHEILASDTLLERTSALLRCTSPDDRHFQESRVKEHFFLVGSLAQTGQEEDEALLRRVIAEVCTTLVSYRTRVYSSDVAFITAVAAFVELHQTLGNIMSKKYFSMSVLSEIRDAVYSKSMGALEDATKAALELRALDDVASSAWSLLRTEAWDVMAAAVVSVHQVALQHCVKGAAEALRTLDSVRTLINYVTEAGASYNKHASSISDETRVARNLSQIVLSRNASKMLQSELCGLLCADSGDGVLRASQEAAQIGCFLNVSSSEAASLIKVLISSLTQRLTTNASSCALSGNPWSTILSEHFRCVYNAIFVLCQRVDTPEYPSVIPSLQDFALTQMEQCWTTNLSSVYDILNWIVSCRDSNLVDHITIVREMFEHVRDVGAKQHVRVSAIAYSALHHIMPLHPEVVVEILTSAIENDTDADRTMYFVGVAASLQVLSDPETMWPHLKAVLLHATIYFNAGRDEEENESTMAATEPLLASWPEEFRMVYPPSVRMATVGRALALSSILYCCSQNTTIALSLCSELLRANVLDDVITHEPCMPNSKTHRARIRLWQLLCALLPLLPRDLDNMTPLFEIAITDCVPVNNLGSVRRFIELFCFRLIEAQPSLYHIVASTLGNYNIRPQVCGTYVLIACYALLQQEERCQRGEAEEPGLFEGLFPRLLQQSTSNQHLLRIISHIGIYRICKARMAQGKQVPSDTHAIFSYIESAGEHVKFREKHENMLFYDTKEAASPSHIFCLMRKEANTVLRECIPAAAFERMRFMETELSCLTGATFPIEQLRIRNMGPDCQRSAAQVMSVLREATYIPHAASRAEYFVDYSAEATELLCSDPLLQSSELVSGEGGDAGDNIQKKVSSWWNSEVYNELHPRALRKERQSIVVVGSLLENPVNIAGLCRCGEIFTVEEIVVPEKKVFDHPHFVATARSAELWIPWKEVMPKDLPAYLFAMRQQGYVIVGIEQTASSVSMAGYEFPERVVVVLGAEGRGIPAPLIPLLDMCVEIPQYGLIRSLNVHVTGAIVMYEYTRQHLMCANTE